MLPVMPSETLVGPLRDELQSERQSDARYLFKERLVWHCHIAATLLIVYLSLFLHLQWSVHAFCTLDLFLFELTLNSGNDVDTYSQQKDN